MSVSETLGTREVVELPAGPVEYRSRGEGPPIVFVHGVGVNGDLWRRVAPPLALAGHRTFALDLRDVTLVANDTGGAVTQWLLGHFSERVGRVVLTSCDAFHKFPPAPQLYLKPAARLRVLGLVAQAVRWRWAQRTPFAYGWTTKEAIDPVIMDGWVGSIGADRGVLRDLARLLLAVDTRYTFEAADALPSFGKPALVVWGADDKLFPREHGRRLAELLDGRFELIEDCRTFVPEEQPRKLVAMISDFLA